MTHILRVDEMAAYHKKYDGIFKNFGDHHTERQYIDYILCGDLIPYTPANGIIVPFNNVNKNSCLPVLVLAPNGNTIAELEEQIRDIIDSDLTPINETTLVEFCKYVGESFEYEIVFKVNGTLYNEDDIKFADFLIDTFKEYNDTIRRNKTNIDIVTFPESN